MNIYTIRDNLKNTIAGKEMLLETYNNPFVSPYPKPVMETLSVALRNNINELNQILKDVEVCCIQDTDKNWIISPDQNGA